MKTIYKIIIVTFLVVGYTCHLNAQNSNYPEIGKSVPDFVLRDIDNYSRKNISSETLKGKFVILYFWSRFCSSAVSSLPKVDKLYKQFKDSVDIVLVGGESADVNDKYMLPGQKTGMDNLKILYDRIRKKEHMRIPIAFSPELFQRFIPPGEGVPHVIWIDNKGVVRAVTSSIDPGKIQAFIKNRYFEFRDHSYATKNIKGKHSYDRQKPYLVDGNGGKSTDFLYRSLLSKYKLGMPDMPNIPLGIGLVCDDNGFYPKGRLEGISRLSRLYKLAYLGYWHPRGMADTSEIDKHYNRVLLEVKDSTPFTSYDFEDRKHMYCYSLIVPPGKATRMYLMEVMQRDLKNYFGYHASVEWRKLPYWKITATEQTKRKLKAKGGVYSYQGDNFTVLGYRNVSADKYFSSLLYLVKTKELPIINETGIEGNIDIKRTDVALWDFEDIKRVLQKQGFSIKKAEKEFKVVVISD
ncbi:TlpA family protein disulfide reductase [Sinomicrobium pectinilyticum]|nr:redoxin domain-containing protein [Sinomicrobium pectinilyticum]